MRTLGRPRTEAPPQGPWRGDRGRLTAGLVLTVTLAAFESLAVITILPVVTRDLHGLSLYGWAVSAFFLGTLLGIVLGGDSVDRRGPAVTYVAGLGLFAAGLVAGGLAPRMEVLVTARAVQGVGAGVIPTVAYVSIGRAFPEGERPRVFAWLSTAWVVPGIVGPAAAALVAQHLGWRWVLLGLVPFVAVAGALTVGALRALPAGTEAPRGSRALDALRVAAGAGLVLAALSERRWPVAVGLGVAGLAVGLRPLGRLMPSGTVRGRPGLPAAVLCRGLLTFAFFGADTFVPLAITAVRGQQPAAAGLVLTTSTLTWTAASWLQAQRAARWSGRALVACGMALVVAGIAGVAVILAPAVPWPAVLAGWAVGGFGIGLAYAPISMLVLRTAAPGAQGAGTAAMQLADNLGVALGAGLGGAAVAGAVAGGWSTAGGIAVADLVSATLGAVGILVALRLPRGPLAPRG